MTWKQFLDKYQSLDTSFVRKQSLLDDLDQVEDWLKSQGDLSRKRIPGHLCPACMKIGRESQSRVLETRTVGRYCRRRRECEFCQTRYSTIEVLHQFKKGPGGGTRG